MVQAIVSATATIVVALIAVLGSWASGRNSRALAHQEADLLKKLDPDSVSAWQLQQVLIRRIDRWHYWSEPWWSLLRVAFVAASFAVVGRLIREIRNGRFPETFTSRSLAADITDIFFQVSFLVIAVLAIFGAVRSGPLSRRRKRRAAAREEEASTAPPAPEPASPDSAGSAPGSAGE